MHARGAAKQGHYPPAPPGDVAPQLNQAYNHAAAAAAACDSRNYKVHAGQQRRKILEQPLPLKLFYDVVLLDEVIGRPGHGQDVISDPAETHDA